jgi:drug/metabolite transporter (DMT)-like permease
MAVLLGLASAIVYGAADFAGGLASRRSPALTVVVVSQAIGTVILLITLAILRDPVPGADVFLRGALAGVAAGAGVTLLYRGLSIGQMSVVAPITAAGAACVPLAVGLVRGERPGVLALFGAAIALVSIVLVSAAPGSAETKPRAGLAPGLIEAVLAGLGFGLFFIALDGTGPQDGLWPLLGARSSLVVCVLAALVTRTSLRPAAGQMPSLLLLGLLDQAATVLFILATRQGLLSLVAVLVSLYPASTVLLARVVLRERLSRLQLSGVACAAVGVVLIAVG